MSAALRASGIMVNRDTEDVKKHLKYKPFTKNDRACREGANAAGGERRGRPQDVHTLRHADAPPTAALDERNGTSPARPSSARLGGLGGRHALGQSMSPRRSSPYQTWATV